MWTPEDDVSISWTLDALKRLKVSLEKNYGAKEFIWAVEHAIYFIEKRDT